MILILSENNDHSTGCVIEWLNYYSCDVLRINYGDLCELIDVEPLRGFKLKVGDTIVNYDNIDSYWYRRGHLTFSIFLEENNPLTKDFSKSITNDYNVLVEFIHKKLESLQVKIGNYYLANINKLIVLQTAATCGLNIPNSYIGTFKKDIASFMSLHDKVITKCFSHQNPAMGQGLFFNLLTAKFTKDKLSKEKYSPSLVQEMIKKKYELRVFFLKNEFYSSAIFSQTNEQTKIDFRDYDHDNPNRVVPYKLPKPILTKLKQLVKILGLDTGSIDLIVDETGNYIFLEINPVGQFGNISYYCNYYLEEKIAKKLALKL
jgi:ATP-GRASP peptide maturase of grasp-with-spasm system